MLQKLMDDYCFDRAVACKRNLNCVFSFNKKKCYFDKFILFSALEQRADFFIYFFSINGAVIGFSNLIIFKSLSFPIRSFNSLVCTIPTN